MLRVRYGLAAGLVVVLVTLGVVLTRAPLTVAGSNGVKANFAIAFIRGNESSCERGGTLPQGTEAIRVSLSANIGPKVGLEVRSGSKLITEGERDAGWGVDETVTVPVRRVAQTAGATEVCTTVGPAAEGIQVNGEPKRPSIPGVRGLLLRMEYLRPGTSSWLSMTSSIARHMGLSHSPTGSWGTYLAIAVMVAVCALASRLILRELG